MKRRYLILAGSLAACACLTLGVLAMLPVRPGVTKANFDRIEEGMTREEVKGLFGGQDFIPIFTNAEWFIKSKGSATIDKWRSEDGACATVWFGDEAVTLKMWSNSPQTIFDKLRRWLHLKPATQN